MNQTNPLQNDVISTADTLWVIVSACLVMLMTPSLGFFYAGLVRQKNILTMLIQCYAIFATISIVWSVIGFTLCYGDSIGHLIGSFNHFGMQNIGATPFKEAPTVYGLAFFFFQLAACAITPALIIGASAERLTTFASLVFSTVWVIVVYCPICHWVWKIGGMLDEIGTKDFGGGLVVHMSAGYAAIALSLVLGKRNTTSGQMIPHNVTYVVLGAALLWFGWFGYNGGSAFAVNFQAILAVSNTNLSCSSAGLSWGILEYHYKKRITVSGIATATVCGLIAMTPGSGFCPTWSAWIIGFVGGILSYLFIQMRESTHLFDDALDVAGCHGVCGTWGVFATGLFANINGIKGLFAGGMKFFIAELTGIVVIAVYSFTLTYVISTVLNYFGILRASEQDEEKGLDFASHEERAYIIVPDEQALLQKEMNHIS